MSTTKTENFLSKFTKTGAPITDLSRIDRLLELVGNPQDDLKFVHIAGTNGKGSTATFIAEILADAGYRTGLFTSPYMIVFNDRIRVNGENISDSDLEKYFARVEAVIDSYEYSQFEIIQTAAFLYYKDCGCDIVVLETGIGGKNDSTNIIAPPLVAVITSVSFDHTGILGDTLLQIANQKAGIIKATSHIVVSPVNSDEVKDVIMQRAYELECNCICPPYTSLDITDFSLTGSEFSYKGYDYKINLGGKHQVANALTAIEAVDYLSGMGFKISTENIKNGLERARIPLRMEQLSDRIVIDGAHNPGGMNALCSHIQSITMQKLTVVLGMLTTKDAQKAAAILAKSGIAQRVLCVGEFAPNATDAQALADLLMENQQTARPAKLDEVLDEALSLQEDILICGSLYLCTQLRERLMSMDKSEIE